MNWLAIKPIYQLKNLWGVTLRVETYGIVSTGRCIVNCVTNTFTALSKNPVQKFPKPTCSEPACYQTHISVEKP